MEAIYVTRPVLPPRKRLDELIDGIYERQWLTNNGPLNRELTARLAAELGEPRFAWVSNGTVAIQLAARALGLSGSVLTTPLTYVASANALRLEGIAPVFVDVDPGTMCIDPAKLEAALRPDTTGVLGVHVYGVPCAVDELADFAKRKGLPLIFDAAHAFGVRYRGRALAAYGDAATLSFHATKVFNTVEGGGVVLHDDEAFELLGYDMAHGHSQDDYRRVGHNAKNSELHAAVGLLNIDDHAAHVASRRAVYEVYAAGLTTERARLLDPTGDPDLEYNYAYAPVLFDSEERLLRAVAALRRARVFPRRYFWPALHTLVQFASDASCPVATALAPRLLCLPLYPSLALADAARIVSLLRVSLAA